MATTSGTPPAWRTGTLTAAALAGLTLLALALRLACVRQSIFGDEIFLFVDVHDRSLGQVLSVVRETEKTPPLGFVLGWVFARGGDPTTLARLPSLVASVATVPLVFALGLRTVGRSAALVAATWFALSAFAIFYATENRAYALVTALCVLSTLALLLALEHDRVGWWALYAAALAAAVYSHYTAVLVLGPQAAWALWQHRDRWRPQAAATGAALVAFAPWIPGFLEQAGNSSDEARRINDLAPLTVGNAAEAAVKALVGHPYATLGDLPGWPALAVLGAALVVAAILAARRGAVSWLLLLLALAPLVLIVLYSAQPGRSLLLPRNLDVGVPYALLLLGALLTAPRPRVAIGLSVVALAAVAVGTVKVLTPDFQRPDARAAARFIETRTPGDAIVVDVPGPQGVRVYLGSQRRVVSLDDFGPAEWRAAARDGTPIVYTFLRAGFLPAFLKPPPPLASRARQTADRSWPSAPSPIGVRAFVWVR